MAESEFLECAAADTLALRHIGVSRFDVRLEAFVCNCSFLRAEGLRPCLNSISMTLEEVSTLSTTVFRHSRATKGVGSALLECFGFTDTVLCGSESVQDLLKTM